MEFTGKIILALPQRTGTSQRTGAEWVMQTFVIESLEQYPKHMAFEIFGADRLAAMNPQVGEICTVQFDLDAREYQGRWYNSVRAWRIDRNAGQPADAVPAPDMATPAAPAAAAPQPLASPIPAAAPADNGDDLPF